MRPDEGDRWKELALRLRADLDDLHDMYFWFVGGAFVFGFALCAVLIHFHVFRVP